MSDSCHVLVITNSVGGNIDVSQQSLEDLPLEGPQLQPRYAISWHRSSCKVLIGDDSGAVYLDYPSTMVSIVAGIAKASSLPTSHYMCSRAKTFLQFLVA